MSRIYQMSLKEYQGLLQVASEQVPFGLYAVEKGEYAELRCDHCQSITQLKKLTRQFKSQGFKVYVNRKDHLKETGEPAEKGALMGATR